VAAAAEQPAEHQCLLPSNCGARILTERLGSEFNSPAFLFVKEYPVVVCLGSSPKGENICLI